MSNDILGFKDRLTKKEFNKIVKTFSLLSESVDSSPLLEVLEGIADLHGFSFDSDEFLENLNIIKESN